ncbi:mitogen-activated protein kinase [Ectocarpus siliculosus]|uniref:Mitogen-activated protein kinase n=1 Tax=Ectocarpus siliculosus TaxID=2880 RepID=D8LBR2_ECTSI|nr:mitogen-activated protein kinase [Ectocarpus siliculosus]|eukprot:CBN76771.1 mitogen-activated protein kinase [Ectocarpus siliculosus]
MFKISERYKILEAVGKGSYGMVCSAVDSVRNNAPVAIKKITPMAAHSVDAKHVLREVRVMRHLGQHENIVTLEDLFCNEADDELYIVMELLDSDLNCIIQSQQVLSIKHHRVFMIQILQGVEFLHKNGVIHRDLKPGNILVRRNCEVRITDFGLARQLMSVQEKVEQRQDGEGMTEHVVTRWYRPPELMLSPNGFYGFAVDLWSVGCIFGELLGRRPLFPGSSFVNQLSLIFDVLGAPAPEEVAHIRGAQARKFLDKLDGKAAVPFTEVLPGIPADAASLLKGLLLLDPVKRFTPREALRHPFFDQLRERASLDVAPAAAGLEFEFEKKGFPRSRLKELIAKEIDHFQAGGANLTLHPKKRLQRQCPRPRQQQQHVGPSVSGAAALPLKTAAAAAAACSSASFSSESDSDHYGDDEEEEEGDGRDDDSVGGQEDHGLDAKGGAGAGAGSAVPGDDDENDDVARLDAASLQSSRLCPKEEEEDGATTEGGCRSEPRRTPLLEVTASSTSNESGNDNDDNDGMTLSSSSPASSSSSSSPSYSSSSSSEGGCADDDRVIFFERVATGYAHGQVSRRGAPCGDHRTTKTNPYRERETDRLRATTLPLASGDAARIGVGRPLGGGGTHRSPPRVRSRTQDGTSDFLLVPAEESAQHLSPPSQSDQSDGNGIGSGVVVVASENGEEGGGGCLEEEEEEDEPRAFPRFDSLAETSPTEPDGSVRSFLLPSPAKVVPPARPTRRGAVAGFVRGSGGWVGSDGGGTGGTCGGRSLNLFVGLQSPLLGTAPGGELLLPPGVVGRSGGGGGVVGVGSVQSEEEESANGSGGGFTFREMSTVDSRSTVSESSSASDALRRERAERAWRVVEEARERLKARADAVVAAAAAAKAPAVGAWRAERAAAVASESTRTAAAALMAPSFDHAEKWPVEFPCGGSECSGSSQNAKGCIRRPPMSVATLEQATENTSWLLREGGGSSSNAAKPTSNGKSGAGVCGGKKQAPLTHHLPSPLVVNGNPFCDFVSGKTSLVTHGDPFCDYYVSGKTTVSVSPAAHPAAAPAPAAEAPPAPTGSGSGSGFKVPVMVVGQKLHVRGASAAYVKRGGPRLFFGGSGSKKSGGTGAKKPGSGTRRSHHPRRAPVATVHGDQQPIKLRPAVSAKRFDLAVSGIDTSSVTSSQGSPPPVPPPLRNRYSRGRKLSRVGSFNRSGSGRYRAPTRVTAGGHVGVYPAAVVVVDSGFGRGRRRAAALPLPISQAMRAKAKGGGGSRATKSGPVLARPPRGAATPVSAGERAGTRTPSHEKYYSVNDVVTLKLPDRFCASSPGQSRDPALSQTRSLAGTRSSKPVDPSRLTISASGKPESIPPAEMLYQWADDDDEDDDAASVTAEEEAGAAAGEGGGGGGGGVPCHEASSTTMVATTTPPAAAAAETAVTDDAVDDAGDSPLTSTTTDVAAVPEADEETRALGPGWGTASLASAVPEAPKNETKAHDHGDSPPSYQAACPPPQQLNRHQRGAAQSPGHSRPRATESVCNFIKEEEVVVEGGEAKEGGGGGNDEMMSASSAEQKFTLLRRLWKRSGAVRGSGKQRRGGLSSRTRSYGGGGGRDIAGGRVPWAGAGPPPKRPPQQQPRPRRAGSLKLFENIGEDDDRGFGDETASLPTLMARAESLFPIPPRMDAKPQVSTSSQQQVRDTPLPGTEDKSHSRSISSQTTTTTGTSPASSATSGYRLDGPQALPLVHETVGQSGSPPTRRGSAISSVGSGCTAASSLRPGGRRCKDNIVRAVQFAPQEKEVTPVSGADDPREHRL